MISWLFVFVFSIVSLKKSFSVSVSQFPNKGSLEFSDQLSSDSNCECLGFVDSQNCEFSERLSAASSLTGLGARLLTSDTMGIIGRKFLVPPGTSHTFQVCFHKLLKVISFPEVEVLEFSSLLSPVSMYL